MVTTPHDGQSGKFEKIVLPCVRGTWHLPLDTSGQALKWPNETQEAPCEEKVAASPATAASSCVNKWIWKCRE